jgi:hypothetical protein
VAYKPVAKRWLCKERPFLGNARNIHEHNNRRVLFSVVRVATVSRQRLGKHFPAETNTHATYEELLETRFYVGPCRDVITETIEATSVVLCGSLWREDLRTWSWRISTVRSRCQRTTGEDTAGWKRLSVCCGDLWIVEISNGAVITSYESWVHKWSVNRVTNPHPVTPMRDNLDAIWWILV